MGLKSLGNGIYLSLSFDDLYFEKGGVGSFLCQLLAGGDQLRQDNKGYHAIL